MEPTKMDTPCPETKEFSLFCLFVCFVLFVLIFKTRWQEERNHDKMKSHIQLMLGDPLTGEQQYQRSSPIAVKVLSPMSSFTTQGSIQVARNPKKSDFEGEQDLTAGLAQDWGKQRVYSCRAQTKSCVQQDSGDRSNDHTGD